MGKTRRTKSRNAGSLNPMGFIKASDITERLALDDDEQPIGPVEAIRDQLQDVNMEEKLNGLQSLAVLTGSKDKVAAICRTDVVRIAASLLCERDQAVRNAAAGALRNLSVNGPDVCDFLVEQDVLTPLLALLAEYMQDDNWTPSFDANMRGALDLRSDVFLQAINLLWNLCESTSIALDTFNQTQMLDKLIDCLDYKTYGLEIAISVAQCLLVVSENNQKCWNVLSQNVPALQALMGVTGQNGHIYLRTLVAGIFVNVPALAAAYATQVLAALMQTFEIDHQTALTELTTYLTQQEVCSSAPEVEIKMDTTDEETEAAAAFRRRRQELPTDADIAIRDVGNLVDAKRVAAEIITNLCSSEEEEWIDADDDDNSENEGVIDYDITDSDNSTNNLRDEDKLPVELVEAIKAAAVIDKLWLCVQPITGSMTQLLRETSQLDLLIKAKNLRISSLLCLQNLCNALNSEDFGGTAAIYNVWVELGQQVFKGPQDLSLLEPSTSLMRATLEHLKPNRELFSQMTRSDLELMLNGVQNCTMPEIRANWLRMLGTLGCLLPEEMTKAIISFITMACSKEDDVWTISEALDALMDMFADNEWPQIIVDLNLPYVVKELEIVFKTKIRQQRRELKERYPAVQTVRTNLPRFIKYIEKEAGKCRNGN